MKTLKKSQIKSKKINVNSSTIAKGVGAIALVAAMGACTPCDSDTTRYGDPARASGSDYDVTRYGDSC
ncbi:hypothetical protein [Mesonia sp. K7]|uniref:hypothetical protein n=1 Tax=Mesonia sp. K7 TaxID=2218606 RepID=UPI000DAA3260|nr:hypothetical protein [Mesonia sp. K7]PZD79307.1 hypothetical protein DNG35_02140 [Mesonia sp. K7]